MLWHRGDVSLSSIVSPERGEGGWFTSGDKRNRAKAGFAAGDPTSEFLLQMVDFMFELFFEFLHGYEIDAIWLLSREEEENVIIGNLKVRKYYSNKIKRTQKKMFKYTNMFTHK